MYFYFIFSLLANFLLANKTSNSSTNSLLNQDEHSIIANYSSILSEYYKKNPHLSSSPSSAVAPPPTLSSPSHIITPKLNNHHRQQQQQSTNDYVSTHKTNKIKNFLINENPYIFNETSSLSPSKSINKSVHITTTTNNNNNQVNSKTNEPIIYIDSIDELENYSISSSISSLSSISSPNKSSQSDTYTIDMNQLLARLKQTTKNLNCDQTNKTNLTPSNSVESFEFISDNNNNNNNKNTCYEQSWHNNQTSQILDQITTDKVFTNSSLFLASSLIEIANKHQQQQQQQINNKTALKYRKYKSNVPANRRISFPIQKMPSFNEFEKLTSIPSSRIIYNSK